MPRTTLSLGYQVQLHAETALRQTLLHTDSITFSDKHYLLTVLQNVMLVATLRRHHYACDV